MSEAAPLQPPGHVAYVVERGDTSIPVSQAEVDAARILVRRAKLRNQDVAEAVVAIAHAKPAEMHPAARTTPGYAGPDWRQGPRGYGMTVLDQSGDIVGRATGAFPDDGTGEPRFIAVVVNPSKPSHLVPLAEALSVTEDQVQVPYDKVTIETAPIPDSDHQLSEDDVRKLHEHDGVQRETRQPRGRMLP